MITRNDIKWLDTFADRLGALNVALQEIRGVVLWKDPTEQAKAYDALLIAQGLFIDHCELNTELVGLKVGEKFFFEGCQCTVTKLGDPGPYRNVTITSEDGDEMILGAALLITTGKRIFESNP